MEHYCYTSEKSEEIETTPLLLLLVEELFAWRWSHGGMGDGMDGQLG
jgi:hypothetical protein